MMINWVLVWKIGQPILLLVIGGYVSRWFERRPKLIRYLVHPTSVVHNHPEHGKMLVNLHGLVVRNTGKKAATNVRLGHNVLPDFSVYPNIQYRVEQLPGGGAEIIFPIMVAGAEVTIQYLYFSPLTVDKINTHVQSDEGAARSHNVWITRRFPTWFNIMATALFLAGAVAIIYLAITLLPLLLKHA